MRIRVTAVLVARHGGEWLEQTLDGLAAQTRRPDRVVAVLNGGRQPVAQRLAEAGVARIVDTRDALPFGLAVQQGVAAIPADPPGSIAPGSPEQGRSADPAGAPVQDWLWLLTEDSAPEPQALEQILATVQRAPSVAVAGPKLVNWDRPERIIELGQSLTHRGERWLLRRQELDQQQYDHLQDVLGVGPVGTLIREDVWRQLGGFDPAYPVYDDGLDFSVRARLAGYRVVVSPASRVRFAQRGIAGPRIERSRRVLRVAHRRARTAELHRRISYAPGLLAFLMWLGLPLVSIGRVAWALIREQPGQMWGEFASALAVFFTPGSILASRRRIRRSNSSGWGAVRPLRIDRKSVRTARMIDREAILSAQGRQREDLDFIATGGLAVLLVSAVGALALTWWALTQTSLTGGALAPLSPLGELWAATRTQGGVPADPFAWVLAALGTLTFWNPSHAVVLLLVAAVPLAALGGWIWGAQLTRGTAGRVLVGLGWALSPVLLGSLAAGRLPTLILAVVLPWLLLAAARCRDSWSWAGTASLLAGVALACAPVLAPAAAVLLVVGIVSDPRRLARVLSTAIVPLALFAPGLLGLLRRDDPLHLLLDPGISPAFTPGNPWHLLLGFPEFGLEGWAGIFDSFGLGAAPATLLVGVLLLTIVLLAALGLITGRVRFTLLHAALGGAGLLTAVASSKLLLLSDGPAPVAIWTGSGLALYWISVLGLAAVGTTVLRRGAAPVVAVGLVTALLAAAPLAVRLATAHTDLVPGETQMPAIVQAAGAQNPSVRTVLLSAAGEHAVRVELVTGPGVRLDQLRSASRAGAANEQDQWLADLVGLLASTGDGDRVSAELVEHGVGFVLLEQSGNASERALLQGALDENPALSSAGQTDHGLLWRVQGADVLVADPGEAEDAGWFDGTGLTGRALWWLQVIVLLGMVLMALPTGEVVERPERRRKGAGSPAAAGHAIEPAGSAAPVDADTAEAVEPVETGPAEPETVETGPAEALETSEASEAPEGPQSETEAER